MPSTRPGCDAGELLAAGHRVVHGGDRYTEATLVDDEVERGIEELVALAPLHNPPALAGIRATRAAFPDLRQVAVFDTAFFAGLPAASATYAVDREVAAAHGHPPVRRARDQPPVRRGRGRPVPRPAAWRSWRSSSSTWATARPPLRCAEVDPSTPRWG